MQNLTTKTLKIFWQHSKKYRWQVAVIIFGVLGHIVLQNLSPILYKRLIDILALGDKQNIAPALHVVFLILGLSVVRFTVARGFNFVNNYFQPRVMADLENTCFEYLQKHSYSFFSNSFVGSLVTKVKRYERSFENIADQLTFDLGRTVIETSFIFGVLFYQNHTIGLMTMAWAAVYYIFSYFYSLYKLPVDKKRAEADSLVTARLADTITNNFNVKIFSAYDKENKNFTKVTNEQFKVRKKSWDLGTIADLIQAASMVALEVLVMYTAVKLWQNGEISIGTVALVQSYFYRLFDKFWGIGKQIRSMYEALADANEMTEILLTEHEVKDAQNAKKLKVTKGEIVYENVNFTYKDGSKVFKNFNFRIAPGERVALIGPSGGGKTSLIKLLYRFYDINSGKILIDGQDISKLTQDSLRENLSLVPQEPILFHRSLLENIRYGKPNASETEVIEAAKKAHAHEFISGFKEGYGTLVGERGIKLSGGERQRVAIARAILKDAPILVMDEATSSLDSESEMLIQDAMVKLMANKTVIVIAHRLSTIMQMNRIVVIDKGSIAEEGQHQELLKAKQGIYQKLWKIQAGGFA